MRQCIRKSGRGSCAPNLISSWLTLHRSQWVWQAWSLICVSSLGHRVSRFLSFADTACWEGTCSLCYFLQESFMGALMRCHFPEVTNKILLLSQGLIFIAWLVWTWRWFQLVFQFLCWLCITTKMVLKKCDVYVFLCSSELLSLQIQVARTTQATKDWCPIRPILPSLRDNPYPAEKPGIYVIKDGNKSLS